MLEFMRAFAFALCLCLGAPPVFAINWEGHDDWLAEALTVFELERHFDGSLTPRPAVRQNGGCRPASSVGTAAPNPYEPVLPLCKDGKGSGTRNLRD